MTYDPRRAAEQLAIELHDIFQPWQLYQTIEAALREAYEAGSQPTDGEGGNAVPHF